MRAFLRRQVIHAAAVFALLAVPAVAETPVTRLAKVILLPEVVDLLREEGIRYGQDLDRDMLGDDGGQYFANQVSRLYDTRAMLQVMRDALERGLSEQEIADSLAFFDNEQGRRILQLEVSARKAVADPAVNEMADEAYAAAVAEGQPRVEAVDRFMEVNDLTERNVSGALNSNYQFYVGLVEGGGNDMSEAEITDEVWGQEEDIRAETEEWLTGFLYLAYGPLSDAEMRAYLDYSASPAGQALNAALFDGFDEMYRTIYYALGLAVAQAMKGSDL